MDRIRSGSLQGVLKGAYMGRVSVGASRVNEACLWGAQRYTIWIGSYRSLYS